MRSLEELIAQLNALPRDAEQLERRLELCREALYQVPEGARRPQWAWLHFEIGWGLAQSLRGKTSRTGRLDQDRYPGRVEEALGHFEQALEVYRPATDLKQWVDAKYNAALLYERQLAGDAAESLEQAIALHQEIVAARTDDLPLTAWAESHLALARLHLRRLRGERGDNVEAGLGHVQECLRLLDGERHSLRWAEAKDLLGTLYRRRLGEDPAQDVEAALGHHREALEVLEPLRDEYPEDWARVHHNLGAVLLQRVHGERQDNVAQAIVHLEQAQEVRTRQADPAAWADTQLNLSTAYLGRSDGHPADHVRRAIDLLREVEPVYAKDAASAEWAMLQRALGDAHVRSVYGERAEHIERAIEHYERALSVPGVRAQERAAIEHNLAVAYSERLLGERRDNLTRAIEHAQAALSGVDPRERTLWALIKVDLVDMLWKLALVERAQEAERATALLEGAVAHGEEVVDAFQGRAMSHRLALAHYNLGNAYGDRVRGVRARNQRRAIERYEKALTFYTPENYPVRWADTHNNLAVTYHERAAGAPLANQRKAIEHYQQAMQVLEKGTLPVNARRTGRNLGHLYLAQGAWGRAVQAFEVAIDAAEVLYQTALLRGSKEAELAQNADLYRCAAYAMARDGQLQRAVETLERGRARLLSDALALGSEKPPAVPQPVWNRFGACRTRVRELQAEANLREGHPGRRSYVDLSQELGEARGALDQAIAAAREHDASFMPDPRFPQIAAATAPDRALLHFALTPVGSVALVVHGEAVEPVWRTVTEKALRERLIGPAGDRGQGGYLGAYLSWRQDPTDQDAGAAWLDELDATTEWLWDATMGPVVASLVERGIGQAVLVPQGWLGLLPLHAAWTDVNGTRRWAMDDVCFSYAANALAFAAASERAGRLAEEGILAVDNPRGNLPNSDWQVAAALAHFARKDVLGGLAAKVSAVRERLPAYDVLHFFCHGAAGFSQPLEGGLEMADGRLTLRDIFRLRLERARLAVLSACETAVPGTDLPDEVISLPSGLVQAGVAGVVGSLWSVSAISTMLLVARTYELWKGEGLAPPEALRQAQLWVRDTTNGERVRYLASVGTLADTVRLPDYVTKDILDRYRLSWELRPDENDYTHPFYWAAFGYTGA